MITGISPVRVLFLEMYIPWCFLFVEEPKPEKYSRLSGNRYFHEASLFECRFLAIHGSGSLVPLHENRARASCGMKSICAGQPTIFFVRLLYNMDLWRLIVKAVSCDIAVAVVRICGFCVIICMSKDVVGNNAFGGHFFYEQIGSTF